MNGLMGCHIPVTETFTVYSILKWQQMNNFWLDLEEQYNRNKSLQKQNGKNKQIQLKLWSTTAMVSVKWDWGGVKQAADAGWGDLVLGRFSAGSIWCFWCQLHLGTFPIEATCRATCVEAIWNIYMTVQRFQPFFF